MRCWTTREAREILTWARTPAESQASLQEMAAVLDRTPEAVQEFLRRMLPPGQRPWREKPRWRSGEIEALEKGHPISGRSEMAAQKYEQRRRRAQSDCDAGDHVVLTIRQVAADLGVSRATVYRLLRQGYLRRFKGGVADSSFRRLLRQWPEFVRRDKLSREQREWLVLNGYKDPEFDVKRPSVRGLLK